MSDVMFKKKSGLFHNFVTGYAKLQHEIIPHRAATVEQAFQLTLEYEKYLKAFARRFDGKWIDKDTRDIGMNRTNYQNQQGQKYKGKGVAINEAKQENTR